MEWQRWDGKGWERSRDGNTAFDISADCRVQSQSAYRRGNEARTHAVYNIITILVSPLAIFPTWMRDMNQWTAIADVFSFVSNAHSAAHIHRMATGNVLLHRLDFKRIRIRIIIFPRIVWANNKWTWSGLLLPASTTTYFSFEQLWFVLRFFSPISARTDIFSSLLSRALALVYSRRSQLYKRIREHRMQ